MGMRHKCLYASLMMFYVAFIVLLSQISFSTQNIVHGIELPFFFVGSMYTSFNLLKRNKKRRNTAQNYDDVQSTSQRKSTQEESPEPK